MSGTSANSAALSAAVLLGVLAPIWASAIAPEVSATFDHARHEASLQRAALDCTSCHRVGLDGVPLQAPGDVCHSCHVDALARKVHAPRACSTCHPSVGPPDSHTYGWIEVHGAASRGERCNDCHRGSFCIDCHERREPVRYRVHDRTFLGLHGIEVQTAPSACGGCHVEAFCVACHSAKGVR